MNVLRQPRTIVY